MIRPQIISAYTPSNTDPATLERIFVQRMKLLSKLVKQFESSMLTGDKHHVLLVGPRGSGKTHLVTLVQDRLRKKAKLGDKMRIAWLGEDSTFTGLIDLAVEIAEQLAAEYPAEFEFDFRTPVRSLPSDDAAESILHSIIERLNGRSILLIMENLDRAFYGLGEMGQKKWRAFLQETARIATLATSQQLFEGISSRDEAFFGFFDIHHLEPLSVDDARELIKKIANEHDNRDLIQFLDTSEGRYRVRALHNLAGGNHRMYVLLSEFLTKESLDDLVAAFESLADELTPYFQERVRSLSPQQARIVQCLCNASGAMTVKEIAEDTFVPERNCSKQLGDLKQKGYVKSEKRGKESYYEMAEPLMRLCLEVKNQRGKPLKLVATFLRAWFPIVKLTKDLAFSPELKTRSALYRARALELDNDFEKNVRQQLVMEITDRVDCKQFADALSLADELICADRPSGLLRKAFVLEAAGEFQKAAANYTSVIDMDDVAPGRKAEALIKRGFTYDHEGDIDKALADYTAVIAMQDAPDSQKVWAWFIRGMTYRAQGNVDKALVDYTSVIAMKDAPPEPKADAFIKRGVIHAEQGEADKALADYTSVISMKDAPAEVRARALINRGFTYGERGNVGSKIADFTSVIEMDDASPAQKAKALISRGSTYGKNDVEKSLSDYTSVIEIEYVPASHKAHALLNRGVTYGNQGEAEKELADLTSVITMEDAPPELKATVLLIRGINYGLQGDIQNAICDCTGVIEMEHAPVDLKAQALNNRAGYYWGTENFGASQDDFVKVIEMEEIPSHSKTEALFYLPESIVPNGSRNEAIVALLRAFEEGDRETEVYGGTPDDLLKMVLRRGHKEWREYVTALVPIYLKYGAGAKLSSGLTKTIAVLDAGDYSHAQLDLWNSAWQEAGRDKEELSIALSSLDAAIRAIKTGSDRPLFDLPLEIREIVRPLLNKSLGTVD